VVLLSPACASFDFFSNFEERGNFFKKIVREIELNENAKTESK
jgi:UDP-N-acetylmuramoylalanine--D-glutamate ligase